MQKSDHIDVAGEVLGSNKLVLSRGYPKWPGIVALVALVISVIALWTGLLSRSNSVPPATQAAQFTVRYMESGMSHSWGPIEKIIPVVDGFNETYEFSNLGRDYKLRLTSKKDRLKTLNYEVQFCQLFDNSCIDIHVPHLSVVPGQTRPMSARSRSAVGPNGEVIVLRFSVQPMPVPPVVPEGRPSSKTSP